MQKRQCRPIADLLLLCRKGLNEIKASVLQLSFKYISIALNMENKRNKPYETLDY